MLGFFNKFNIIKFTNKIGSSENFDSVQKVVLYGIIDNKDSLLQLGKYGAINPADPTTMVFYVINYLSEPYTLHEYQTIDGKISKAGVHNIRVVNTDTKYYLVNTSYKFLYNAARAKKEMYLEACLQQPFHFRPLFPLLMRYCMWRRQLPKKDSQPPRIKVA